MAYVHCHKCGWRQDDFYHSDGYNPAKYLLSWNDILFGGNLDKQFTDDAQFVIERGPITTREVIAQEYEKFANRIRKMKWVTAEEFYNDPNKTCPLCNDHLDID